MQTATQLNVPPHLIPGQQPSEIIVERVEDKTTKVIVFVGDFLTDEQKQYMGRLGGKLFPEAKTLQPNLLTRCNLTPLKQGMMSVPMHLVDKKDWKNYISTYVATNQWNPVTQKFENIRVGADANSKDLIYRPIYPVQEIGSFTGKMDGVVEVTGLSGPKDIAEAQFYFFPDWLEIAAGVKLLPKLLRELRDEIQNKTLKTSDSTLIGVGNALLRSCDQYLTFGKAYIDYQTKQIEEAKKHNGVTQSYDEIAERFFLTLELTRQDSLIQDFARQQNQNLEGNQQIQTAISLLTKIIANQQNETVPVVVLPEAEKPQMDKTAYLASLQPSITGEETVADQEPKGDEPKNVAACTFPKADNKPCKGTVIPNTDPPRCVTHKDK